MTMKYEVASFAGGNTSGGTLPPAAERHNNNGGDVAVPVGYRFKPTDEELVKHYLMDKAFNPASPLPSYIGRDIQASRFLNLPPHRLVSLMSNGEREWFLFIHQDQDLESEAIWTTGCEVRRMVGNGVGFWRSFQASEKPICDSSGAPLGFKSQSTYFTAASSSSSSSSKKTHWKLHEYRLHSPRNIRGQEWVLARLIRGTDYNRNM
ncbi:unnamed protein product [Linum tenue]|uniref:NAC domain-containing protein n=1 Tax=Linum tenue TaxID=586396 RepID=A0AAV0LDI5_9ROSI|nr:unnamed protein product [Linum tenue]